MWFLGSTQLSIPNGILISSAVFALFTAEYRYTLQWAAPSNLKIAPYHAGISTPIYYMVPWAHPSPQPKWHVDRLSCFCRAHYCDRPTHRPRYSVGNHRLHLHT